MTIARGSLVKTEPSGGCAWVSYCGWWWWHATPRKKKCLVTAVLLGNRTERCFEIFAWQMCKGPYLRKR
jgi:hypothetical protein